jgi:hypothetical protein
LTKSRYVEALSMMYTENTFAISGCDQSYRVQDDRLYQLLRCHLFSQIRRLLISATATVVLTGTHNLIGWECWTMALSQLPLLRELEVHVFFAGRNYHYDRCRVLEFLGTVRQPKIYIVFEYHARDFEIKDVPGLDKMPYRLRRTRFPRLPA